MGVRCSGKSLGSSPGAGPWVWAPSPPGSAPQAQASPDSGVPGPALRAQWPSDPSSGTEVPPAASPAPEVVRAGAAAGQEGRGAPGESPTVTRPL